MLLNLGRILRQLALQHGSRPALVNIERERRFSHRRMDDLSNRVCHLLARRFSLGEGDFYATLLDNDNLGLFHPWMFKSPVGAVWIDLREPVKVQLEQIDYARPGLVFLETRLLDRLYEPLARRGLKVVVMDRPPSARPGVEYFWDLVEEAPPGPFEADCAADDPGRHIALLRFTGGTTGRAKCAAYSLSNLWAWGLNPAHYYETFPFGHPRAMFSSPLGHAASGSVVIPVVVKGGTVITLNRAELEMMGRVIAREKVEMIYAVPTVLYRLLDQEIHARYDLRSLKTIRYGAAPISPAKLEALLKLFGRVFVQGYGSTECWPSVTILGREDHGLDSPEMIRRLASVGRPFPGQEVIIRDDRGRDLGPGESGEIQVRGANTIRGYFKAPDLTRENFTPDGFWRSGDIGYLDQEGYLFLVDRKKDVIISGGYNVYATEVENCLNSHPAVRDSAVVGVQDPVWGEAVWAVVVLAQGAQAGPEELIAHCKSRLARHKAPKTVRIATRLPLSPAGKVLRREVRQRLRNDPQDRFQ